MKSFGTSAAVLACLLALLAVRQVLAQASKPKTSAKPADGKSTTVEKERQPAKKPVATSVNTSDKKTTGTAPGRLPRFFGQLDLDDQQRAKIQAIQDKYDVKLRNLRQQIASLKADWDSQIQAVLTPAQSKKLEAIKAMPPQNSRTETKTTMSKKATRSTASTMPKKSSGTKTT